MKSVRAWGRAVPRGFRLPEHAAKSEKFVSRAKIFARASGIFVILIGLVALSGWIFDVPKLKSIYGDITMKANAALAQVLFHLVLPQALAFFPRL